MFNVGPTELLVILALALMVFGPKRLPEMSRQIGRGLREFRRATQDVQNELHGVLSLDDDDDDAPAATVSSNGSGPPKADPAEAQTGASTEEFSSETHVQSDGRVQTETPPVPRADAPKDGTGASNGHTVIDPAGD